MKKIKIKKTIIYTLVAMIVSTSIFFSYEKASRVKASAFSIPLIYEAMLTVLAMGGVYISYDWITDGNNALQLWEECEEEYNKQRFSVINGGASGEDPDEDPNDIPEWEVLTGGIANNKCLDATILGSATYLTIGVISKLCNFLASNNEYINESITDVFPNLKVHSGFSVGGCQNPHIISRFNTLQSTNMLDCVLIDGSQDTFLFDFNGKTYVPDIIIYKSGTQYLLGYNDESGMGFGTYFNRYYGDNADSYKTSSRSNHPIYTSNSYDIYISSDKNFYFLGELIDKTDTKVWIHPDYKDSFDASGSYEILSPPSDALGLVNLNMLHQLQQQIDASKGLSTQEEKDQAFNNAINNFNDNLIYTDITPTPNPNPDEGEDSGESEGENNSSFLADLSHLFPFCIPFDLIDCVKLLTAERETPCVQVPMHFKFVDVDYTWVIDLEDFNGVASVCRTMFLLLYIVGLAMVTRPLIRG